MDPADLTQPTSPEELEVLARTLAAEHESAEARTQAFAGEEALPDKDGVPLNRSDAAALTACGLAPDEDLKKAK